MSQAMKTAIEEYLDEYNQAAALCFGVSVLSTNKIDESNTFMSLAFSGFYLMCLIHEVPSICVFMKVVFE